IVRPHEPLCYLKIAVSRFQQEELLAEKERLGWLQGRLPVPQVYAYSADGRRACLLLSEIAGRAACDTRFAPDIPSIVRLLGEGLRLIHRVEIADCPFDQRLTQKLAQAQQRVEAGVVDVSAFDEQRKGIRAAELFETLLKSLP